LPGYRPRHQAPQPHRGRQLTHVLVAMVGLLLVGGVAAFAAPMLQGQQNVQTAGGHEPTSSSTTPSTSSTTTSSTTTTTSPAPAANPNCTLIVPPNPLSAAGLATPYQLTATDPAAGPCHEANANQSAFVEAAILTADGHLTLYDPLVIDRGTQPAFPPVAAHVPDGSTVGIWFGFNGTNLTLQSAHGESSLKQGNCVNGLPGSIFGQFAYCNAVDFFDEANEQIAAGKIHVPALATARDGQPCPSTRSFAVVDQDQSDNVVVRYLATPDGRIAQNNAAARAALAGQQLVVLTNPSDNLLLSDFIDPALGCVPWMVSNQSSDGQPGSALALDELQAAAWQRPPIALVPLNDPMTLVDGKPSVAKTNLYRVGVDQLPIGGGGDNGSGATYCTNLFGSPAGIQRVFRDMAIFQNAPSPVPAAATNLFTFLAMRGSQSFVNLGCQQLLGVPNPITLTTNAAGVVTGATIVPLGQTPPCATPTTTTSTSSATSSTTASTTTTSQHHW
jgi:hypothetical protein